MREKPDSIGAPNTEEEEAPRKRIELNAAQVAGSAVAAVVAAKLASYFGVYGTILGAGVVSVIATCGGTVFQHFFRRTGEQIRTVRVSSRTEAVPRPAVADAPAGRTPAPGEFTEGTVYRARVRSWKRPVLAAALVFGVTMAGITVYETASGSSFSGGHGTTVGDAVTGRRTHVQPSGGDTPTPATSPTADPGTGGATSPGGTASHGTDGPGKASGTPAPDATASAGTGGTGSDGAGPGSESTGAGSDGTGTADGTAGTGGTAPAPGASATTPAPSASSRSGTGAADPAGPEAR
ncbi:hypothetical protein ACF061_26150 [Streptomyces sp. NPDC015220]|uniref:hypothetical protein n=1 Tax=Streptomyces sp. NPDC015220 TaxID=3364947 RepID=UPI0036F6E7B5